MSNNVHGLAYDNLLHKHLDVLELETCKRFWSCINYNMRYYSINREWENGGVAKTVSGFVWVYYMAFHARAWHRNHISIEKNCIHRLTKFRLVPFQHSPQATRNIKRKEARVCFRVRVPVSVRYGGTIILRKVGYRYRGDICFIKFFYILLCIYFSYIDKQM